jgi:NADH:ubiquinone oxidoreductase subunit 6 (subunit J)
MSGMPGAERIVQAMFGLALLTTVAGAILAVATRRIIRSVCGLALCCLGLAGLYYFLESPFLTLMEILIYIGAVCVTIVFAVMLAEPDELPPAESRRAARAWGATAAILGVLLFAGLSWLVRHHPWPSPPHRLRDGTLHDLGVALLTTYGFAFELISVVLVVAILGALLVARYGRTRP